jgi:hypothetical protein
MSDVKKQHKNSGDSIKCRRFQVLPPEVTSDSVSNLCAVGKDPNGLLVVLCLRRQRSLTYPSGSCCPFCEAQDRRADPTTPTRRNAITPTRFPSTVLRVFPAYYWTPNFLSQVGHALLAVPAFVLASCHSIPPTESWGVPVAVPNGHRSELPA